MNYAAWFGLFPVLVGTVCGEPKSGSPGRAGAENDVVEELKRQMQEWMNRGLPESMSLDYDGESINYRTPTHVIQTVKNFFAPDYKKEVSFYLCNKGNKNGTLIDMDASKILKAGWKGDVKTKIVVHGWGSNSRGKSAQTVKNALLNQGDYNVIQVDWSHLCPRADYIWSRGNVMGAGACIADFVDFLLRQKMLKCEDVHIIGWSLGAHLAGAVGRRMSCKPGRVTALEPARPLFLLTSPDRVSKEAGVVVDVIHTCSGYLGLPEALGTIDFYPNGGGMPQPGCHMDMTGGCSHHRALELFVESANNSDAFESATLCATEKKAMDSDCADGDVTAKMGFCLQYSKPGSYYIKTASSSPFDVIVSERKRLEKQEEEKRRKKTMRRKEVIF